MKNIIFAFVFCVFAGVTWGQTLDEYIVEQCRNQGVSVNVAMEILREENPGLDFDAVHLNQNGSRDLGLWQLNDRHIWTDFIPRYWDREDVFRWDDPYHSTYLAIRHIRWLYTHGFNHWQVILSYNAGYFALISNKVPESSIEYANRAYTRLGAKR
jgi:hypothetical protein